MKKTIAIWISSFFLILLAVSLFLIHSNLRPKVSLARSYGMQQNMESLDFTNFEEQLLIEDGTYFLWFCDNDDKDCSYVENEYMTPILDNLDIDHFSKIIKIDFTNCPFSEAKMKDKFNVNSKLAFIKAEVVDQKVEYSNILSWSEEGFSFQDLEKWLYDNNIWQEAYENKGN